MSVHRPSANTPQNASASRGYARPQNRAVRRGERGYAAAEERPAQQGYGGGRRGAAGHYGRRDNYAEQDGYYPGYEAAHDDAEYGDQAHYGDYVEHDDHADYDDYAGYDDYPGYEDHADYHGDDDRGHEDDYYPEDQGYSGEHDYSEDYGQDEDYGHQQDYRDDGESERRDSSRSPMQQQNSGARSHSGSGLRLAQIAMAVLFVMAVVATSVMVLTNNGLWMRVGLLAALWSALFGAFLFARERRLASFAAQREAELKRVYALELESEVAARREHDLRVKETLREEVRSETEESLNALRVEVMALRSQLEQLGVQPIVDEDVAIVGAAARRIINAAPGGAAVPLPPERTEQRDFGSTRRGEAFESLIGEGSGTDAPPNEVAPRPPHTAAKRRQREEQATPSMEVTSTLRRVSAGVGPTAAGSSEESSTIDSRPADSRSEAASVARGSSRFTSGLPESGRREQRPSDHDVEDFRDESISAHSPVRPNVSVRSRTVDASNIGDNNNDSGAGGISGAGDTSHSASSNARHATSSHSAEPPGLETFRLSPPPNFADDSVMPDFDAPTGFEPVGWDGVNITPKTPGAGYRPDTQFPAAESVDAAADPVSGSRARGHGSYSSLRDNGHAEGEAEDLKSRHGEGEGVSVAELLARLQHNGGSSSGGGRRRRAED